MRSVVLSRIIFCDSARTKKLHAINSKSSAAALHKCQRTKLGFRHAEFAHARPGYEKFCACARVRTFNICMTTGAGLVGHMRARQNDSGARIRADRPHARTVITKMQIGEYTQRASSSSHGVPPTFVHLFRARSRSAIPSHHRTIAGLLCGVRCVCTCVRLKCTCQSRTRPCFAHQLPLPLVAQIMNIKTANRHTVGRARKRLVTGRACVCACLRVCVCKYTVLCIRAAKRLIKLYTTDAVMCGRTDANLLPLPPRLSNSLSLSLPRAPMMMMCGRNTQHDTQHTRAHTQQQKKNVSEKCDGYNEIILNAKLHG